MLGAGCSTCMSETPERLVVLCGIGGQLPTVLSML